MKFDINNIDRSNWKKFRFDEIVYSISERVEPGETDLDIYVGLEHLDPETIHIKRTGVPSDVEGTKLRVYKGDVIFGKRRAYQRKAAIAHFDGICSAHAMVLRANEKAIDPKLFPFFMHSDYFMHRAIDISVGSLSPTINWGTLKTQEFLLPPKELQAQLAELLWAADEVIEKYDEVKQKIEKTKFRFLQEIINPLNKNQGLQETLFGLIPKNWEIKKVTEIADVGYGISDSVADNKDSALGCPILTGANINLDGTFELKDLVYYQVPTNERFLLKEGDLLFNWRSGSPFHVGKTAYFDLKEIFTYASFILRIRPKENFNSRFGWYLFNYLRETEYFIKGISQQVNFKMNAAVFREIELPVPPFDEQTNYANQLDQIRNSQLLSIRNIKEMNAIRKQLINQIFSA